MKTLNNKGISTAAVILIVVVILLAGGLVWWVVGRNTNMNTNQNTNVNGDTNNNKNTNVNITTDPVTGWNVYINDKYGYRVKYPKDWVLKQAQNTEIENNDVWTASISNRVLDDNSYHPLPGELVTSFTEYKTESNNIEEWYADYKLKLRLEIYESVVSDHATINNHEAIIQTIITGSKPSVPVDVEWLNGKEVDIYVSGNKRVMEISSVVTIDSVDLLNVADSIARSFEYIK